MAYSQFTEAALPTYLPCLQILAVVSNNCKRRSCINCRLGSYLMLAMMAPLDVDNIGPVTPLIRFAR